MKHRIYTKQNRQFRKPLSKTTKSAVRKAAGKAKDQPAARKAPGRPAKKSSWKAAAKKATKATLKEAQAAPAARKVRVDPRGPQVLRHLRHPGYLSPLQVTPQTKP